MYLAWAGGGYNVNTAAPVGRVNGARGLFLGEKN